MEEVKLLMIPQLLPDDLEALSSAKALLESPGIAIQIANLVGAPVEYVLANHLPKRAKSLVDKATKKAVTAACRAAVATMKEGRGQQRPRNRLHKLAAAASGTVGGLFGLAGLPIELPTTTTIMLRSILDIARSEGESLRDPATRVACLEVLALGGSSKRDDGADSGYFAVRTLLAQQVSAAVEHLTTKGLSQRGAPPMVGLVGRIASYFAIPVSEKVLAQAIPVVGAVTGGCLNVLFIDHFQNMARGHFVVRRLERIYGQEQIRLAYAAL